MIKLCQEFLQLVYRVSEKYYNVRVHPTGCSNSDETEEESSKCCPTTTFIPENITFQGQCCGSDCSSDVESVFSKDLGGVHSPEEHDIKPDEPERLYDNNGSCSSQVKNKSDDDDIVKECYSVFNRRDSLSLTHRDVHNEAGVLCVGKDNFICPGNVVEFRDTMVNSAIKRDSIVKSENSNISANTVLKSGDILHPTKHAIFKVKVYCSATYNLIPNPLGQWFCIDKCLMQNSSLNSKQQCEDETSDSDDLDEQLLK